MSGIAPSSFVDPKTGHVHTDGYEPNQLDPRLLGVQSLVPWVGVNSSSRQQMFASHIAQTLVISHPTPRRITTGMELHYGDYTFNYKMPEDGRILKITDRFPSNQGFKHNSERLAFYINNQGMIGVISLPYFTSNHSYFGFRNVPTQNYGQLIPNQTIPKDTVLMDSPSKGPNGEYMYGRELNVAYITHPATADDGIVIRRGALPLLSYKTYEKRIITSDGLMPLNIYGDNNLYKAFPDIGELCHPKGEHNGLLMALREYDQDMVVIDQSVNSLQIVDHVFDTCYYAAGPGGRVVDIQAYWNPKPRTKTSCDEMMQQVLRYANNTKRFHQEIVDFYLQMQRQYGHNVRLTDDMHRLVVESMAIVDYQGSQMRGNNHQNLTYKKVPLGEMRMVFTVEYTRIPDIGNKLTDTVGGKSIMVLVADDEDMPVDINGKRADICSSGNATNNRMNDGRFYEHFVNGSADTVINIIRQHLNIPSYVQLSLPEAKRVVEAAPADVLEKSFAHLQEFYNITVPRQANEWYAQLTPQDKLEDLAHILNDGIYLQFPTDNEVELVDMVNELQEKYPPLNQPVRCRLYGPEHIITKNPVMIASNYFILLNKDSTDYSAASLSQTNHLGILTHQSSKAKHNSPTRSQSVRGAGESERRHGSAYTTPGAMDDLIERSTSIPARRHVVYNLLTADKPSNVKKLVDRNVVPRGTARPLQIFKSVAKAGGWWLSYKPFNPDTQQRLSELNTDSEQEE